MLDVVQTVGAQPSIADATRFAAIEQLVDAARVYAAAARSAGSAKAYASDVRLFGRWCTALGVNAFPAVPGTVALYAAELAQRGYRAATIRRRMIAIGAEHRRRNLPVPTEHDQVREVLRGIRRSIGVAQRKKEPLRDDELRTIACGLGTSLRGRRDRALLAVGYTGALRRSELAALQVGWLHGAPGGLEIRLPTSKTDQDGRGETVVVEYGVDPATCPVGSLRAYLATAQIESGAVFREIDRHGKLAAGPLTGDSITRIVQRHVAQLLVRDPRRYGAHSLRAGFATVLDERGASLTQIMRRGRWKSERVARGYIRTETWRDPLGAKLGL